MTLQIDKPLLDPYDYDFHEDPYPYYRRLRDEAPLYRNEELGFWALSRHADVHQGFRDAGWILMIARDRARQKAI